ncbi:MAG: hypothetical protein ACJAQ3_002966, partial [Planctomycetota bacterium]
SPSTRRRVPLDPTHNDELRKSVPTD